MMHAPERVMGWPIDRLFGIYLLVCIPAFAFPHRPSSWPLLLALHAFAIALLWPLPLVRRLLMRLDAPAKRRIRAVADWAPLLLIPLLYRELAILNRAVHDGAYFDDMVIGWEQAIFGSQPSQEWAAAAPYLWLSEPLHAAYISYYLIIFTPPVLLFLRRRSADFRNAVFALMLTFSAHYVFFIYFPVQGPRYLFPAPSGELANGFFFQLAHRMLEAGSAQGAAFPSSHVGVSVAQTLVVWRYLPRLTPVFAVLTIGLALGAIYGGFHYAIDAVAGLVLGIIAFVTAPAVSRWLARAPHAVTLPPDEYAA